MKILAITGSVATGKSSVTKMFGLMGTKVIDTDKIVFSLYKKNSVKKILKKNFGKTIISKTGFVKRKALAKIVFSNKIFLKKLNSLIHPLVLVEVKKKLQEFKKRNKKFVALEVPVLFESKTRFEFDYLVVAKCSKKIQLKRMKKRDFTEKEAFQRIKSQLSIEKKLEKADFVIDTSKQFFQTRTQVKKVFESIKFLHEKKSSLPGNI